jgi:hypothetical protein
MKEQLLVNLKKINKCVDILLQYAKEEAESECYVICACQDKAKEVLNKIDEIMK